MEKIHNIRRWLLMNLVPEIVWKKYVIFDGVKIPVRGMQYTFGVKWVLTRGLYEDSERFLIRKILKEGDSVLEMGASIGVVTAIISDLIGSSGRLISIEASELLANQTRQWIELKGNVKIIHGFGFPVYEVPNKYGFVSYKFDGNSLGGYIDFSESCESKRSTNIFDLSRIESEFKFKPTSLVLDIEGSEIVLLEPNIEIPEYINNIVIEMHPGIYGENMEMKIIAKFFELGFIYKIELKHVYLLSRFEFDK
jgi:FkbM family methyltransferase